MADNRYVHALMSLLRAQKGIRDWRFAINVSRQLDIGINQSRICGPYAPPTVSESLSSQVYIRWKDGKVSKVALEPHHFERLASCIKEFKEQAYVDKEAARILGSVDYPSVRIYDPTVMQVMEEPSALFSILAFYSGFFKQNNVPNVDAQISCSLNETFLRSSTGIDVSYTSTGCTTSCYAAGQYGEGDDSCKLLTQDRLDHIARNVAQVYLASTKQVAFEQEEIDVVFSSEVMDSFVEHFLESNMEGASVIEGESAFSPKDFQKRAKRFNPSISYIVDSISDYSLDSAPCDEEGVPGMKTYLIKEGVLQTPELDVKYADKLKMPPTGSGDHHLEIPSAIPVERLIATIQDGVIIYGVLGMHTQNASTGEYSLPCHLALRIKEGQIIGGGKISISGNFFKDLADPQAQFGYDPMDRRRISMKLHKKITPMR